MLYYFLLELTDTFNFMENSRYTAGFKR